MKMSVNLYKSQQICTVKPLEHLFLNREILEWYETFFEADFSGVDFVSVRIEPAFCAALTRGSTVYIDKRVLEQENHVIFKVIGHELTHVVQQTRQDFYVPPSEYNTLWLDRELETEAELRGDLAWRKMSRWNNFQTVFSCFPYRGDLSDSPAVCQPLLIILTSDGAFLTVTMSHFNLLWNDFVGKKLKDSPNKALVSKARDILKRWIVTPERTSIFSRKKGIRKEYHNMNLLVSAVIGEAKAELNGGSKSKEARIAALIERKNAKISQLLIKGLEHIYFNFHATMSRKTKYRRLIHNYKRPYAWYYSGRGKKFSYLAQQALTFSLASSKFDQKKLCSVEDAFIKFICSEKPVPSWQIVAFIADFAKIVKQVYPSYFSEFSESWFVSESEEYARKWIDHDSQQSVIKHRTEKSMETFFKGFDPDKTDRFQRQIIKQSLRKTHRKRKIRELKREFTTQIDDGEFHRVGSDDGHMFFKLPGMRARSDRGDQVNESHEWVKKAREQGILLGDGPSATTMFTLGMFQILYPHEETVLATALAVFEFWNRHYKAKHSGIHTWHEVMYVAQQYTTNFDFARWKKVDRKTRQEAWRFSYPNSRNFKRWLEKYAKRKVITVKDLRRRSREIVITGD